MPDPSARTHPARANSDASRQFVTIPAAIIVEPARGSVKVLAFRGSVIAVPQTPSVELKLEETFYELAEQWRRETGFHSSPAMKFQHPLYLQIIGLGQAIIPFLLREVKKGSASWFVALRAITRLPRDKDPVTPDQAVSVKQMCEAWVRWGKENNYEV